MGRTGTSAIEILIVLVLIGVIAMIGFPRMREAFEKQNVRNSQALLGTMVATARSSAVQRGCNATLNLTGDSAWVTACGVNPPAASVQVGTKKLIGSEFSVTLQPTTASVVYDPRGLRTTFQQTVVRVIGAHYQDSVVINEVGKVIRQ
jgi:Tfp pilus assembly protein FimT